MKRKIYLLIGTYICFQLNMSLYDFFRMESPNRIQSLSSFETKSFLVDSSKARRKIVEFEQLPNWHDSSSGWRWRHLGTHFVQGKLNFPTFPADFYISIFFSNLHYNCSNFLDPRNLQEQVKKAFCYQKLFWPYTVQTNCSSDREKLLRSHKQFIQTVKGQNNFW